MNSSRNWRAYALVLGDVALLNATLWVSLSLRHATPAPLDFYELHVVPFNLLFASWLFVFFAVGLYDLRRLRSLPALINSVVWAGAANLGIGTAFFYFFYPYRVVGLTPKTHLLLVGLLGPAAVFAWRRVALHAFSLNRLVQRVAFLGEDPSLREIREDLKRNPHLGYVPVPLSWPGVDLVVADGRWADEHWDEVEPVLAELLRHRVPVLSLPTFYEGLLGKVLAEHAASASWLFGSVMARSRHPYHAVKRALDLVAGGVLAAALALPMALAGLACLLGQGRPVLFGQDRVGRLGRPFTIWKFRTMRGAGDETGPFGGDGECEARITPLGAFLRRWRIDEWPQLWNVLRGDMSLVGPRPEWTKEVAVLERAIPHYALRHLVRPGLTGWAQLNFRATSDLAGSLEKFRFDLFYLQHVSLDLDLTILLRTARRVLAGDEAMPVARQRTLYFSEGGEAAAAHLGSLLARRNR